MTKLVSLAFKTDIALSTDDDVFFVVEHELQRTEKVGVMQIPFLEESREASLG